MRRYPITCPACGKGGHVPARYRGRRVKCPRCSHSFQASTRNLEDSAAELLLSSEEPHRRDPRDSGELYL
jgi:hypothetical protein